jgi:hypothetical protein
MYLIKTFKRIENIHPYPNKQYYKKQWECKEEEINNTYENALNKAIELYKSGLDVSLCELIKENNTKIEKTITWLKWSKNG